MDEIVDVVRSRALPPDDLVARLRSASRAAVAAALNLADDQRPGPRADALALLDALDARPTRSRAARGWRHGRARRGQVDAARRARARAAPLGADGRGGRGRPVEPAHGGALLGDRIRMRSSGGDAGVFIRSMAARDRLGGIAEQTWAAVAILASAFDHVFVETVGVGPVGEPRSPTSSTRSCSSRIPGSGDTLQFMKAGLLELVDVFVVNKSDTGALAQRTARELEAGVRMAEREAKSWEPPVLLVSARDGAGTGELLEAIASHRRYALESGALRERRARGRERFVIDALARRYGTHGVAAIGGEQALLDRLRSGPARSAFGAIEALGRAIEGALGSAR
jgi:LAO/AO transport system kinase